MSSFLVSIDTITAALDGIINVSNRLDTRNGRFDIADSRLSEKSKLGQDLFMMNFRALSARYKDDVPYGVEYTYKPQFISRSC